MLTPPHPLISSMAPASDARVSANFNTRIRLDNARTGAPSEGDYQGMLQCKVMQWRFTAFDFLQTIRATVGNQYTFRVITLPRIETGQIGNPVQIGTPASVSPHNPAVRNTLSSRPRPAS